MTILNTIISHNIIKNIKDSRKEKQMIDVYDDSEVSYDENGLEGKAF